MNPMKSVRYSKFAKKGVLIPILLFRNFVNHLNSNKSIANDSKLVTTLFNRFVFRNDRNQIITTTNSCDHLFQIISIF